MKNIKILVICLVVVSTSCQKEKGNVLGLGNNAANINFKSEINSNAENSYDLFFKDSYGSVSFKATRQYYNQKLVDWDCIAYFSKQPWASYEEGKRVYENVGNVRINSLEIPAEPSNTYLIRDTRNVTGVLNSFMGSTVKFSIDGSSNSGYDKQSTALYIPKQLNAKFEDAGAVLDNRPIVKRGSFLNLKWDADPLNTKGVVVIIENVHNVNAKGIPDMTSKNVYSRNILILADDGDYTFTADDFKDIPDHVELLFTIIRGNIAFVKNKENTLKLYGSEEIFANQYLLMP